jgi:hypothetical protein
MALLNVHESLCSLRASPEWDEGAAFACPFPVPRETLLAQSIEMSCSRLIKRKAMGEEDHCRPSAAYEQ